jgi:cytoskeletal protein RodZ
LASFGIGAKLRQERLSQGLTVDDIARDTRIASRYLEAIEKDDYSSLPGLIFARNFVRQYAVALKLDPEPLLAGLPKQDASTALLPDPPARSRSSFGDRNLHSILSSSVWLALACGAGIAAYIHYNQPRVPSPEPGIADKAESSPPVTSAIPRITPEAAQEKTDAAAEPAAGAPAPAPTSPANPAAAAPVQVSLTAHATAWVQVSADGKTAFIGTLKPNETKEVSALEQVKISTGNAGALTISLNGKTLESLGPVGQVRAIKLTAEGPQFPSRAPQPAPDPL